MNHYEQLGVDTDATPDQIKQAYRARAREKHPDKGGTADDFAPVARAYEVLSDPGRRLLYDSAGVDSRPPIEVEAQNALLTLISQAFAEPDGTPIIEVARMTIEAVAAEGPKQIAALKARRKKLITKRDKISTTGDMNLVHMVIDTELKGIEANLANLEHQAELHVVCLAELEKYTEETEPEPVKLRGSFSVTLGEWGTASSGSSWPR